MQRQLVIIDSKDRSTGFASNFTYYLTGYSPTTVFKYRVNKVTIPFSWYTIIPQTFQVQYNGTYYTITIPGGQYNAQQLATQITNSFSAVIGGGTLVCTFTNDGTNNFVITSETSLTFVLHFELNNLPSGQNYKSVGVAMGYVLPTNLMSSATPVTVATSIYAINLSGPPNIYVKSSSLQIQYSSFFNLNASTVIQTVPVGTDTGNYIVWANTYPVGDFEQDPVKTVTNWDFQLVDEYNNLIDLRGLDWTIEIELWYRV